MEPNSTGTQPSVGTQGAAGGRHQAPNTVREPNHALSSVSRPSSEALIRPPLRSKSIESEGLNSAEPAQPSRGLQFWLNHAESRPSQVAGRALGVAGCALGWNGNCASEREKWHQ